MRKLLVLCLIVFLVSCKDKDKDAVVDPDFAPGFVGSYSTTTIDGITTSVHDWDITSTEKNVLAIKYTKSSKITVSGTIVPLVQIYTLTAVKATAADSFTIDEVVDVDQTTAVALKQRLLGTATKVTNAAGNAQLNITLEFTNSVTGVKEQVYLEFKKKA
ncbi:hypothetical protein ACFP1I_20845 [Dyadobacter subterraneus]|uniref:Lipocalin-like domain-containing protein n=1 Tax=Dyadobacter subterraneus TaxID=2773304 RepID=A0ABR9W8M1_9BACT|nr:hypothetical protein [Dyadobacter subterraneus]MBE9461281.1 hypothetical protein [Dyadobacter subterraneus]